LRKRGGHGMIMGEEMDQFQLLEQKIDGLLELVGSLRKEKTALSEKTQIQEERMRDLAEEVETLKTARDKARQRILTLLDKIDKVEI
jgi:FtsZ-binding cell division protein ZapB